MNGFLVVFMGDMDDVPVKLFDQRDEAEAYARGLGEFYAREDEDHHDDVTRSLEVMGRDMGTYQGVAVAGFRHGEMTSWERMADPVEAD